MMNNEVKKGHPVVGLVLGVVAIGAALMLTFLTGMLGGGIALILGGLALFMGIRSRSGGRGIPSIVAGAMAILLAVTLTGTSVKTFQAMHARAVESGKAPLMAEYSENPYLGFLGIVMNVANDENSFEELSKEITMLRELAQDDNTETA